MEECTLCNASLAAQIINGCAGEPFPANNIPGSLQESRTCVTSFWGSKCRSGQFGSNPFDVFADQRGVEIFRLTIPTSWYVFIDKFAASQGGLVLLMPVTDEVREFYASQSDFTDPGKHQKVLREWPDAIEDIVARVQEMLIYDAVARPFYEVDLSVERQADISLRHSEMILDSAMLYGCRLTESNHPSSKVAARCNNFCLLTLAAFRAKEIPVRSRSGFGTYFAPGKFEDHWIVEIYDVKKEEWRILDPTFDPIWIEQLRIEHDVLDLPIGAFLSASVVWQRCRKGEINPLDVGIHHVGLYGLEIVAASLVRDIAALCKVELLPWDIWGAQPYPGTDLDEAALSYFDELAAILSDPIGNFGSIQHRFNSDKRLKPPSTVFNALTQLDEAI